MIPPPHLRMLSCTDVRDIKINRTTRIKIQPSRVSPIVKSKINVPNIPGAKLTFVRSINSSRRDNIRNFLTNGRLRMIFNAS